MSNFTPLCVNLCCGLKGDERQFERGWKRLTRNSACLSSANAERVAGEGSGRGVCGDVVGGGDVKGVGRWAGRRNGCVGVSGSE